MCPAFAAAIAASRGGGEGGAAAAGDALAVAAPAGRTVDNAMTMANAVVVIAAMSFLGIGVSPPTPTWGSMIQEGTSAMVQGHWWVVFFPALAIFVVVSALNFIADGIASTADMVTELRRGMGRSPRLVPVPPVLLSTAATLLGQQRRVSSLLGSCEVDDRRFRRTFGYRRPYDVGQAIRNAVPAGQPKQSEHQASSLKRVFDVTLAAAALPVAAPVILACVAAIKATSHGPGIFRQPRVGLNEQTFTCYKLRTMYSDTRDVPSHEASTSSVTPIGRWLRRLKFDELPQLWNILRGDMSFVGPRPCLPTQTALIDARRSRGFYAIRPGITGVSQVAGVDMSDPEKLAELDETYLDDMSIAADLRLIVATAFGAGQGDRVRQ